jgi:hypothetical protein
LNVLCVRTASLCTASNPAIAARFTALHPVARTTAIISRECPARRGIIIPCAETTSYSQKLAAGRRFTDA